MIFGYCGVVCWLSFLDNPAITVAVTTTAQFQSILHQSHISDAIFKKATQHKTIKKSEISNAFADVPSQ